MRRALAHAGAVLHWRHREEEPGLPFDRCVHDACTTIRAALAGDTGQALLAEAAQLRERVNALESASVWTLVGRLDMALEMIERAPSASATKRIAKQLRDEIRQASGK